MYLLIEVALCGCVGLQVEMEDMGVEEGEEEDEAVRNDAMTIFRGHSGRYSLQNYQDVVQILTSLRPPSLPPSPLPQPYFNIRLSVLGVSPP